MKNNRTEIENEWKNIFGTDLPKHIHKAYSTKYIKWHKANGTLNKSLQNRISKLIENYERGLSTFTPSFSIELKTGTRLVREFRGIKYEVTKLEKGYLFEEKTYKSLSAIANKITGTRWNGKKFFGLVK